MKILITGGAGFIGSNLTAFHLNKGDEVFVIDNLITGSKRNIELFIKNKGFRFIQENILNSKFLILNSKFDIVYHLASPASPIQYKKYPIETLRVNSEGTQKVLEFMRTSKSKILVFSSTSEVYGDPTIHPQPESYWGNVNPVGCRSCYDEAKRYAESLIMSYFRKYDMDLRIARIFNTYGPNMEQSDGRVISNFIVQALKNNPITIYGQGKQTRSFCYVSDMVNALYALATTPQLKGEIINLGNADEYSILQIANIIKKQTLSSSPIVFKSIEEDDPKQRQPDLTKAKQLLQWQPQVKLTDGLEKTINYFKSLI